MIEIYDRKGFDRLLCLEGNSLCQADLSNQDLGNANFVQMDLRGADLSNTKLVGADLRLANLSGAKLDGADLSDAEIMGCIFADVSAAGCRLGNLKPSAEQRKALKAGGADLSKVGLDIQIQQG